MTLLELAERCEQASGPDRELDAEIARGLGWKEVPNPTFAGGLVGRWHRPDGSMTGHEGPPKFTASLDAAMTLVPEGCGWLAGWGQTRPDEPMGGARITRNAKFCGYDANYDAIVDAEAGTPALALCAAALRARSHQESQP